MVVVSKLRVTCLRPWFEGWQAERHRCMSPLLLASTNLVCEAWFQIRTWAELVHEVELYGGLGENLRVTRPKSLKKPPKRKPVAVAAAPPLVNDAELQRRALAAYFRTGGDGHPDPALSTVEEHDGKRYVMLRNASGALACYRIRKFDGVLKRLVRIPRELRDDE